MTAAHERVSRVADNMTRVFADYGEEKESVYFILVFRIKEAKK